MRQEPDISAAGLSDLEQKVIKLEKVNRALMGRVERSMDFSGTGFSLFQTAILLEDKVKVRTRDLESTLSDLSDCLFPSSRGARRGGRRQAEPDRRH